MLENFPIMLALCFMLSSPYYAENYAGIIDTNLVVVPIRMVFANPVTYNIVYSEAYHM